MLFKEEKGVLISSEAEGYNEVYERVSKFDGFSFQKYIDSMSSTINQEFILGKKKYKNIEFVYKKKGYL